MPPAPTMTHQPDPSLLLAYVEGELPEREEARLRAQLASQPDLLAMLDRMSADRARLRAIGEPPLSVDLVAALEPLLARPLLMMNDTPGAYRRGVRSRRFGPPLTVAAGLAILGSSVAIAWWQGLFSPPITQPGLVLAPERPALNRAETAPDGSHGRDQALDLHHLEPDLLLAAEQGGAASDDLEAASSTPRRELATFVLGSGRTAVEAGFVLQVHSTTPREATTLLSRAFGSPGNSGGGIDLAATGALVRTFTYADAERVWRDLVAASTLSDDKEALLSAMRRPREGGSLSTRQKRDIERVVRANTRITLGGNVAGNPLDAPAPDDQLRYGELGADLALTLPLHAVRGWLQDLLSHQQMTISLRETTPDQGPGEDVQSTPASTDSTTLWDRWSVWASATILLDHLETAGPADTLVIIPIDLR